MNGRVGGRARDCCLYCGLQVREGRWEGGGGMDGGRITWDSRKHYEYLLHHCRRVGSQYAKQWLDRLQREKVPVLVCLTFADKFYAEYMSEDGQHLTKAEMEFRLQYQLIVSINLTCVVTLIKLISSLCRLPRRSLAPAFLTRSSSSPSLRTGTLSSTHPMADGGWRRLALAAPGTWGRGW